MQIFNLKIKMMLIILSWYGDNMIDVHISWDKLKNVPIGLYPVPPQFEILEWLEKNCKTFEYPVKHISRILDRTIMPSWEYAKIENEKDAMLFKLVWG